MKLGLLITIASGGHHPTIGINRNDAWASKCIDLRTPTAIYSIPNITDRDNTVLMAKFLGADGYLLALVMTTAGRTSDNAIAWIHVPCNINISGAQLFSVIQGVRSAIGATGTNQEMLERIFATEYPAAPYMYTPLMSLKSDNSKGAAVRFYSQDASQAPTLVSMLGPNIAQPEYANYSLIIFLDTRQGLTAGNNAVIDTPLHPLVAVQPPAPVDGFVPYLGKTKNVFAQTIMMVQGDKLPITWRRPGYADEFKEYIVGTPISFMPLNTRRVVRESMIEVRDVNGAPLTGYRISINNVQMMGGMMELSDRELAMGVNVTVQKDGYKPATQHSVRFDHPVQLVMERAQATMPIVLKNGTSGTLTYDGTSAGGSSPLQGYVFDRNRCLQYVGDKKSVLLPIIGVLVGLILGVGISMSLGLSFKSEKKERTEVRGGDQDTGTDKDADKDKDKGDTGKDTGKDADKDATGDADIDQGTAAEEDAAIEEAIKKATAALEAAEKAAEEEAAKKAAADKAKKATADKAKKKTTPKVTPSPTPDNSRDF